MREGCDPLMLKQREVISEEDGIIFFFQDVKNARAGSFWDPDKYNIILNCEMTSS